MKYIKTTYVEEIRDWQEEEITKEEATEILDCFYTNANELVEIPCLYRTMFGAIEVIEE